MARIPVGIVTLKNRTPSPVAKLFIECAREIAVRDCCVERRRRDTYCANAACGWLLSVCLPVKPVGKPNAGNRHVRFDERGWETGRCRMAQATAPILDSTKPDVPGCLRYVRYRGQSRRHLLTLSSSPFDRYCRKKDLQESRSNIDSRSGGNAQS